MNNRNPSSEKSKEAIFEDLKTHPQDYTYLELDNMGINTTDIKILASIIRSNPTLATSLKELGLRDNKIDNEGVNILAELFHSVENNITFLDVQNNFADSTGMRSFVEQYTKIRKHKENLTLFINNGHENDYAEIIKKCANITKIHLNNSSKINWSNKNFLLSFAQNKTLRTLNIGGTTFNKRDPVMKKELAEFFDGLISNRYLKSTNFIHSLK